MSDDDRCPCCSGDRDRCSLGPMGCQPRGPDYPANPLGRCSRCHENTGTDWDGEAYVSECCGARLCDDGDADWAEYLFGEER